MQLRTATHAGIPSQRRIPSPPEHIEQGLASAKQLPSWLVWTVRFAFWNVLPEQDRCSFSMLRV